jgi:twinkle protein
LEGDGEIEEIEETQVGDWEPLKGEAQALPKRGLSKETCAHWRYECGEGCRIANYYDAKRTLVAQKIRKSGKRFSINGDGKNMPLYGQWLFGGGKHLVITEGEIDALSVSQAFDNKWPVVPLGHRCQQKEAEETASGAS